MVKWCKSKSRILCPIALLVLVATLAVCLATSASAASADTVWTSVNLSDYYISSESTDDSLVKTYSIIDGYVSGTYGFFVEGLTGVTNYYSQLNEYHGVFYIGDIVEQCNSFSAVGSMSYVATSLTSYNTSSYDFYITFWDADGCYLSSMNKHSAYGKLSSSGDFSYTISGVFPDGAAFASICVSLLGASGTFSDSSCSLTLDASYDPVVPPDTPNVTDDFGGEVNYLRGQAATPLSVTATVTDGGTLSYQWYYIDSENVDVAVPIDGATGTSYTPDTRSVGTRYYGCVVTNTLGELSASAVSDYVIITVERPSLGSGYDIYDYKDYVTGTEVSGTNKVYYVTFPMQGFYTAEYGGYNSDRQLLDYFIGTEMLLNCPPTDSEDDNYYIRLDYYPLGMCSQPNLLKLSNIPVGTQAGFEMIVDNDSDQGVATMIFLWYDSDGYYVAKTEYTVTSAFNDDLQAWVYATDFIFTPPAEAAYCAYYLSVDGLRPESNFDQYLTIRSAEFYLTISTLDDIQGSVDDVGDKVDQVGDKIDQVGGEIIDGIGETNDKLDDLINGSDASQEIVDRVDQTVDDTTSRGEELLDQLDSVPRPPAQDVVVSVDSWYQNDTEDSYNNIVQIIWSNDIISQMLMLTCTLMLVSYVLFGKKV